MADHPESEAAVSVSVALESQTADRGNHSGGLASGANVVQVGKRVAQVGGLAVAAYVLTAVAGGHGVASAESGDTGQAGSVSSSVEQASASADGGDDASSSSARDRSDTDESETDESQKVSERAHEISESADDESGSAESGDPLNAEPTTEADDEPAVDSAGLGPSGDEEVLDSAAGEVDPSTNGRADTSESGTEDVVATDEQHSDGTADSSPAEPASDVVALAESPVSPPMAPPAAPADAEWSLPGWLRRTFFNRPPAADYPVSLDSQDMNNGVITGHIGAVDPDGDRLTYSLVVNPKYGTVVIDQLTGNFTYTPMSAFAQYGGADSFTLRVTDNKNHLLSYAFSADLLSYLTKPNFDMPQARVPLTVVPLSDPSSPPALEAFTVEKVIEFDVPDGVTVTGADLSPDGEHLILEVEIGGNTQIAVSNLDGEDYQCISCGLVTNAAKARALADERRIWFANTDGQQSADDPLAGAGAITYAILECGGSIYACENPTVKKVKFPSDRGLLSLLPTQNREAKPDPYGEYVTWTENTIFTGPRMSIARLVATGEGYKLTDQRVFSPGWSEESDYALDFSDGTHFYEGASWQAGGRYLKYQTTTTGLNYDIYLLDTLTGERRQITTDLDYNESGDISPDGKWAYFSSARGLDRMDVFTALVRPSLIDSAAFPQIGRVSLWNNRRAMNEPWMMSLDGSQELGGYSGQPIIIDPDWTVRGWSWFPDSTRALINEQQRPDTVTPGAPDTPWRFSIISFPSREPTTPLEPVHQDPAAIAKWSVPVSDYKPMMGRQSTRVLKGTYSGTATLHYSGIFAWGSYSVTYENYSDDGKTFIDGTEKVKITNPMGNSVWSADLTSSGERTGYLLGSINIGKGNAFSGEVSSEINGITYSGVPTQADFPGVSQPQLAISTAGGGVRVTATVPEDDQPRPVRGVAVTVGSVTVVTDENGYAEIPFGPGDTVTATGGGFRSASQQI